VTSDAQLARVLRELESAGLLLLSDPTLPSVASLVAGERIRGSWWGHRAGKRIFDVLCALEDRDDLLLSRLVAKKVTLVHARLVPALVSVGRERAAWQTTALSPAARAVLAEVDRDGLARATGAAAKELELRLLCAGKSVHTESGAHATELVAWERIARARKLGRLPSAERARAELERAASELAERPPRLAWQMLKPGAGRRSV
jgi:hypothetical protein